MTTTNVIASNGTGFPVQSKSTHRRKVITPQTPVWRAFYTKPRHEIRAAARLAVLGIDVYCPVFKTKVRWSDRWKKVTKPLFNGYLFARVDEISRLTVLEDSSVASCVFYLGKPAIIQDTEIDAIRRLLYNADATIVQQFKPGENVQITSGPLQGKTGELIQISGNKVRLRLVSLACEIIATVDNSDLSNVKP